MKGSLHKAARERTRAYDNLRKMRNRRRWAPARILLNCAGALSALVIACGFNLAMFPEAWAQERNVLYVIHALRAQPMEPTLVAVADPLPEVANVPEPNPDDVHLLAATTWAEARSEGEEGMRAVAHVIVNRVGARFGDNLQDVVLSPKQFSAWNLGDPNRPLAQHPERYARSGANLESWQTAQEVAREVLEGKSKDPTEGALFYHTRAVRPWWARFGIGRHSIGAHVFYSDVPDRRA